MRSISKREFIKRGAAGAGGLFCLNTDGLSFGKGTSPLWKWSREAMFWTESPRGIRCGICPNECTIRPGDSSQCHNRINFNDKLYTLAYGNPCAVHIDPIEKKPLLHFLPATKVYSIATAGCNLSCLNCQNWEISQTSPKNTVNIDMMPEKVVQNCLDNKCPSIAYTYSEPVSYYEYVHDTATIAHQHGIRNVLVSNGFINEIPLKKWIPLLDAANINLKSFSDEIYLKLNDGRLQPVLNSIKILRDAGVWLEITNLLVPLWTDDMDMIKKMCDWLTVNGFSDYPLHFTRFHPMYKLTQLPETSLQCLINAKEIALKAGHKYVYIGNVPGKGYENVICPACKKVVVEREGFTVIKNMVKDGKCGYCSGFIHGQWK